MTEALLRRSYAQSEIGDVARQFWDLARPFRVFAFSGTLGAGKTTFIHALCDYLGVADAVSSPTFALINEYHFVHDRQDRTIYHMDWYRLRDAEEAIDAGMEDCLMQAGALCLVEWPERAPELLRSPYLLITLEATGADERLLMVTVM